jgi:hypothetical protein
MVMCANNRNQLIGVRAFVAMIQSDGTLVDMVGLNKYGVMGGSCVTFELDYMNGEFLSEMQAAWGQFAIRQLTLTSNFG